VVGVAPGTAGKAGTEAVKRRRIVHAGARPGARLELDASQLRHLALVLRLRQGAALEVLDGSGGIFKALYLGSEPPQVEVQGSAGGGLLEPEPITVALACVKGPRMDWAAEKLSELGVRALVPLRCLRVTAHPRLERLRRIAVESAKQCGRARLLEVTEQVQIQDLAIEDGAARLLLDGEGSAIRAADVVGDAVVILVGPEGGFTAEERELAIGRGFRPVRIAAPTLRSETAAVAGAAAVIALRAREQG
jgi:16S rRNA (uracil1498-N3)-methyltransferase